VLALVRQIVTLIDSEAYGLYHATGEGTCSWYDFAREIFSITNTKVNLEVAGLNEFPAKVRRPSYSALENAGLKHLGLNTFGSWQEALREYLGQSSVDTQKSSPLLHSGAPWTSVGSEHSPAKVASGPGLRVGGRE
jgi:dTDP-4-dehydrorhamnose reductase